MKHKGAVTQHHGVTGIMPPLVAGDDVDLFRQQINDLAFSLVTPLGADDNNARHFDPGFGQHKKALPRTFGQS